METALLIGLAGVVLVVAVTALAPKVGVASPLLLVILGIGISFLPFVGAIEVEPEWIIGGILPPLLYSAAVNIPSMEFRRDFSLIAGFSVILVFVSAAVIGVIMTWLIPDLPLPLGIALGAIVSPTDAVATTIVKKTGISSRVVTVLEGESLLNDASALVLLRSAVAATGVSLSVWQVGIDFLYAAAIAIAVGFIIGKLNVFLGARLKSASSVVALSLVVPFAAYLPTEHLGGSGLVAAVTAGLVTGFSSARALSPETRLTEEAVWRTIELLLESAIFLIMGLELFALIEDVQAEHDSVGFAAALGALAATVVIGVRIIFVALSLWLLSRRANRAEAGRERLEALQERLAEGPTAFADSHRDTQHSRPVPDARRISQFQRMLDRRMADLDYLVNEHFGWKEGAILVWAGMRGAVTLAAAQSLPHGTPHRSLLILIAFVVAAGTLIIQGGTLSPLASRLGLGGEAAYDPQERVALELELRQAAIDRLADPALASPDGSPYSERAVELTKKRFTVLPAPDDSSPEEVADVLALRLDLLTTQRDVLMRARDIGTYPSALLDDVLRRLDADQLGLQLRRLD